MSDLHLTRDGRVTLSLKEGVDGWHLDTPPLPSGAAVLRWTLVLTWQVLGHTKTILVLLGGVLLFGDKVSSKQLAGMALAVAGMVLYGMANSQYAIPFAPVLPSLYFFLSVSGHCLHRGQSIVAWIDSLFQPSSMIHHPYHLNMGEPLTATDLSWHSYSCS